jgi:hypothetical protein
MHERTKTQRTTRGGRGYYRPSPNATEEDEKLVIQRRNPRNAKPRLLPKKRRRRKSMSTLTSIPLKSSFNLSRLRKHLMFHN